MRNLKIQYFLFLCLVKPSLGGQCDLSEINCISCTEYQKCSAGQPIGVITSCKRENGCDDNNVKQCQKKLGCYSSYECTESGIFPDPTDETAFHVCMASPTSGFLKYDFMCPENNIFNKDTLQCTLNTPTELPTPPTTQLPIQTTTPLTIQPSTQTTTPTTQPSTQTTTPPITTPPTTQPSTQTTTTSTTQPSTQTTPPTTQPSTQTTTPPPTQPPQPFVCSMAGIFPNLTDCKTYYRCSASLKKFLYTCPAGMILGSWGRLGVVLVGGLIVIIAIIIVSCFIGPGCWGYEYLSRADKKKKQKTSEKISLEPTYQNSYKLDRYYWMDRNDYIIYQTGQNGMEKKIVKDDDSSVYYSKDKVFNLKCAPLLVGPKLYSMTKETTPKMEMKLFYSDLVQDGTFGRLSVQIISVTSLPFREYINTLDPYVVIEVLNNKWSLQKRERIVHAVQTRVIKNSNNPNFDETFTFDVKKIEMKNWCLKFTVMDNDRLTKPTPLYEKRIYLKELTNLTIKNDHVPLNFDILKVTDKIGSLLFGVTYLPTAQRLNVNVVKASKLKYQNSVQSLVEFYPYVRVIMLNNRGKCLKKKKTCFKHGSTDPIFNDSLIFDLSLSNLEQTVFLVLLCTKSPARQCQLSNSDDSSIEEDIEGSLNKNKDKVLGTVVLGRNVKCTRARDHWVTILQNPRKLISVWHELR